MSYNTFGRLFRFTSWGESHGPAIGCTVDGVPPRLELSEADIQQFLDQRKPGQSRFTTQRREPDQVKILSGVFEGQTTGTPIQLMIENVDQRSKDYGNIAQSYRPGHADFTYDAKYGIRDYRGGGRSSARETAARVAAGAIARKILGDSVKINAGMVQMGPHGIDLANLNWDTVTGNPMFCPDLVAAKQWETELDAIRKAGSSIGAVIEVVAKGVPAGWGAPVYAKLDADLASAMMSINAAKGVEIGAGMASAALTGEENADQMRPGTEGDPEFLSNNAGGILGGISTGQPIIARFAVKPTSSILTPRQSINSDGEAVDVVTKGRHDPCVGIRAVPIAEAMMAIVLADHMMMHRAQCG
jgi:chorismate synthase